MLKHEDVSLNECKYLGHIVGYGKIGPMQCKVEAVQAFTRPTTKKQVRAFTGLCGYYRRFIPNISSIATPDGVNSEENG